MQLKGMERLLQLCYDDTVHVEEVIYEVACAVVMEQDLNPAELSRGLNVQ